MKPISSPRSFLFLHLLLTAACAPAAPSLSQEGLEGGNLDAWSTREDGVIEFTVRRDTQAPDEWRWFYFRVEEPGTGPLTFEIPDARTASASSGWRSGRPLVSQNAGATWERTAEAQYRHGAYQFTIQAEGKDLLVALAQPYEYAQNLELLKRIKEHPRVAQCEVFGHSLQKRPIHHLIIREPGAAPRPIIWITARQHPAEVASSWKAEGLIQWLLSDDPQAAELLRTAEVHIVPFMNPDGVVLGNYRRNAAGLNLNRVWHDDAPTSAPTVAAVQQLMRSQHDEGRKFLTYIDLHAISSRQKNFMYYTEDLLLREEYEQEMQRFMNIFQETDPLFTADGSESTFPGEEGIAKDWVHTEFEIPTYTFESSYQTTDYGPAAGKFLSAEDYKSLGKALGQSLSKLYRRDGQTAE